MGEELLYQIAITRIPRVGAVIAKTLISYCGGAEAVFRARRRELMRIPGIGEGIAEHITRQDVLWEAEAELEFLEKSGTRALYYLHKDYPTRLKQYPDCPVVLYYQGVAELDAPRTAPEVQPAAMK
jgi:DNA processing protein